MRTRAERRALGLTLAAWLCLPWPADGLQPPRQKLPAVIGGPSETTVRPGDTLLDVAYRSGVGFEPVARLNPDVDVWLPRPGTAIELPTQVILPDARPEGIVINVPELRLFDFTVGEVPEVLPIAIGDAEDPTPLGEFRIGRKRSDPVWNVPISILEEKPELPPQVPPGPENPLGDRWMTVGRTSYGIHGTNIRWSIGRVATHGCIRLYNDDMHRLFDRTDEGTPITIVYQPVKLGQRQGNVFLEVHPDVYEAGVPSPEAVLVELLVLELTGSLDYSTIDIELVRSTLEQARGVPVRIGSTHSAD